MKQLAKVQTIHLPRATKRVHYSFPEPPRSGAEVIWLTNVSKFYGDHAVYRGLNLVLTRGDRVALVGPRAPFRSNRRLRPGRSARSRGRCASWSAFATKPGKPARCRAA